MQGLSGGDPGGCHHIFHQVPVGAVSRHHNDDDADDDNGDGGGYIQLTIMIATCRSHRGFCAGFAV